MKKTISGIRGIFGRDFGPSDVLEFAGNFSSLIKSGRCVIGSDTRPTGPMIKESAKAALMGNGIDVFDLGVAPTPVVFREARRYGAGLVITSSHNPMEWNGLKFVIDGRGINQAELQQIVGHKVAPAGAIGAESYITSSYIQDAQKIIPKVRGAPHIILDIGGGAARDVAPQLLKGIGCKVTAINSNLKDSTRGPDPTADPLTDLCAKGTGFAFDLDGDRLVIVQGGIKHAPDVTLGLGIAGSLDRGCRNFVLSIDTSVAIENLIKDAGGTVTRSPVGEANVADVMANTKAQAGGEGSSGGFILPEFNYCRDGILASGLIAPMLDGPKFKEVAGYMSEYTQVRDKTGVDSALCDVVIEHLRPRFEKEFSQTDTLDGLKGVIDEDSWVLVRKSNTEDIIRVSAESRDADKCKKIIKDAIKSIKDSYEKIR